MVQVQVTTRVIPIDPQVFLKSSFEETRDYRRYHELNFLIPKLGKVTRLRVAGGRLSSIAAMARSEYRLPDYLCHRRESGLGPLPFADLQLYGSCILGQLTKVMAGAEPAEGRMLVTADVIVRPLEKSVRLFDLELIPVRSFWLLQDTVQWRCPRFGVRGLVHVKKELRCFHTTAQLQQAIRLSLR